MPISNTHAKHIGGVLNLYDQVTYETVMPMSPILFEDDFLGIGELTIPTSAVNGCPWISKIVGSGPPTVGGVASAIGGQVSQALTATSEKEDAVLYWGDQKGLDVTKGFVYESRVQLLVLPSAAG